MYLSHPRKTDHLTNQNKMKNNKINKIKTHLPTDKTTISESSHLQRLFLPISLTAKEHWYPQCIWVAPRPGKSKSLTKRGTISSFCSVWPKRPQPPKPQEKTRFCESSTSYKQATQGSSVRESVLNVRFLILFLDQHNSLYNICGWNEAAKDMFRLETITRHSFNPIHLMFHKSKHLRQSF